MKYRYIELPFIFFIGVYSLYNVVLVSTVIDIFGYANSDMFDFGYDNSYRWICNSEKHSPGCLGELLVSTRCQ